MVWAKLFCVLSLIQNDIYIYIYMVLYVEIHMKTTAQRYIPYDTTIAIV